MKAQIKTLLTGALAAPLFCLTLSLAAPAASAAPGEPVTMVRHVDRGRHHGWDRGRHRGWRHGRGHHYR